MNAALTTLRHHVTGAIERGEKQAIVEQPVIGSIQRIYGTVLRCYDNDGRSADRYTILPPRWARDYHEPNGCFTAISASANPFSPQGVGMMCSAMPGPHLGKRVRWCDLPEQVRQFAREAFPEFL